MIAHLGVKTSVGREQPEIVTDFLRQLKCAIRRRPSATPFDACSGGMALICCEKQQLSLHSARYCTKIQTVYIDSI
jgi:hypothetical protein